MTPITKSFIAGKRPKSKKYQYIYGLVSPSPNNFDTFFYHFTDPYTLLELVIML